MLPAENASAADALRRGLTTPADVERVRGLCSTVAGAAVSGRLLTSFYSEVVQCADRVPASVRARDAALPEDWFAAPWYCMDASCAGAPASDARGTFDDAIRMLSFVHSLGFRNVCLLPHYESPLGDAGYDVSAYEPRAALGGQKGWLRFMEAANALGMRVVTEAVFNHTSVRHRWFRRAIAGDQPGDAGYLRYYVRRNGREKVAEEDRGGDIVCTYRDRNGTVSERVVVFPEVDRTHGLWVDVRGKTQQFYRTFHPFQVDLNLRNPDVLAELLGLLAREVAEGILGKRADAVAHWVKIPGSTSEGLPETHAVLALFKAFLRHVSPRAILIPEVVRGMLTTAKYTGPAVDVNGTPTCAEGDALLALEMQAALREATYLQTVAPFWARVFRTPRLPSGAVWMNVLEHHDETYLGFFPPEVRTWMAQYIQSRSGVVFKNGLSAAGRYAECLDNDAGRIATALFALYMTPGTPLVYSGTEAGVGNNRSHADEDAKRMHCLFQEFGVHISQKAAFDPRELLRGPVPLARYEKARDEKFLPLRTVRRLNELRAERASLRSQGVHPVDSGDVGVLCMAREADGDRPVLCVANLTPDGKRAAMPVWQIAQRMHVRPEENPVLKMVDLMTGEDVVVEKDEMSYLLDLPGFHRVILVCSKRNRTANGS